MLSVIRGLGMLLIAVMICCAGCQTTEDREDTAVSAGEEAGDLLAEPGEETEDTASAAEEEEKEAEAADIEKTEDSSPIVLRSVDLSPFYAWSQDAFDKPYAPEIAGEKDSVEWKKDIDLNNGAIDFLKHVEQGASTDNIAGYARIILKAEDNCKVHLSLGSDDGIAVFVNGEKVFKNNVMRGMTPDQDQVEFDLVKGENILMFRVTQGVGDFSLHLAMKVLGDTVVTQVD